MMILDRVPFGATRRSDRKRPLPASSDVTVSSSKAQTQKLETQIQSFLETELPFVMDVIVRSYEGLKLSKTHTQPFLVALVKNYSEKEGAVFCSMNFYFMDPRERSYLSLAELSKASYVTLDLRMVESVTTKVVSDLHELSGDAFDTLTRELVPQLKEWYRKYELQAGIEALQHDDALLLDDALVSPAAQLPGGTSPSSNAMQGRNHVPLLPNSILQSPDALERESPGSSGRQLFPGQEEIAEEDVAETLAILKSTTPQ